MDSPGAYITEDFAISYASQDLNILREPGIPDDLAEALLADFLELREAYPDVRVEAGDSGYGAKIVTLVVIFAAMSLSGKRAEDNVDAWLGIANRVGCVLKRLRNNGRIDIALSEPVALALAVDELAKRAVSLDGLSVVSTLSLPVAKQLEPPELVNDFRHQPHRFYLFVFGTSDHDTWVVTLRSSGVVEEIRRLPTGEWKEYVSLRWSPPEYDSRRG